MNVLIILLPVLMIIIAILLSRASISHEREEMSKPVMEDHATITDIKPVDLEFSNVIELCIDTEEEGELDFFVDMRFVPVLEKGEQGILKHQGHIFVDFIESV